MHDNDNVLSSARGAGGGEASEPLRLVLEGGGKAHRTRMLLVTLVCLALVALAGFVLVGYGVAHKGSEKDDAAFWHVALVSVLFWIGASQAMLALSAILRIAHASWRYPLTRLLDMASLFGLWMPLLFPILVVARRVIYALGASEFKDNVWRLEYPLVWDGLAVGTAFVAGWMLLFLTALPDFAILRDRAADGSRDRKFYGALSRFWRGTDRQWRVLRRAEGTLVVGILLSFVGSQTVLGWDFQLAAARNWESSIFAPLYTLSALLSALALTILVITFAGGALRGRGFFTSFQYDNIGKVMVGIGLVWTYFRICDFLTAWFGHTPEEWNLQLSRTGAHPVLLGLMLLGCSFLPVFANFMPSLRKRVGLICTTSVFILVGVASQRFLDTVPTFAPKYGIYSPASGLPALAVFFGLAGLFVLTFLLGARFLPILSWWGMSKERTRTVERKMGNATVTMMVEDPPLWET